MITTKTLPVDNLYYNLGQIEGVPTNPRDISEAKLDRLKQSIQDFPDMLQYRELVVYPLNDNYIVLGGNMRLRACTALGYTELPCKILPADTPADKLCEFVIKDNVAFGHTDFDILNADWSDFDLEAWGMDMPVLDIEPEAEEDEPETKPTTYNLKVTCDNEKDQDELYNDLIDRGYDVKKS